MNPKMFFGLIFGVPTVLLAYTYYSLRIHGLWQLFLFCWGVAMGYMPGLILYYYYLRDKVRKALTDV